MLNLLTNAIKFTDPGGRILTRWQANCEMARVEVQDSGIGIPQQDLPHVFERFRQADGSSTRRFQGVGLGLALCKELVEEHSGRLTVTSQVGQGTTFVVELPIDHKPVSIETLDAPESTALVEEDPFASTFRAADRAGPVGRHDEDTLEAEVGQGQHLLLVVDDEVDMRQFLVSALAEEYRVLQASTGPMGLDIALNKRPDLILLDMMLPGMDGLSICRRLRAESHTRDLKILLVTARSDEGTKLEALERGVDDFLTKPFSLIEVKTRIRHHLKEATLQRDLRERNVELQNTLDRLQSTEAQLIQSEKMNALGSLAAGLLHEINNPLNYTITAVQLLQDALDHEPTFDDDARETIQDIDQGMKRIRDIVTDLRAFAYPQEGQKREPFEVADALEIAMRFTAHLRNGIQIESDLESSCPVIGSKSQFSQVLVNILVNALHAVEQVTDRREPQIQVRCLREGAHLVMRIRDNGVGIDPESLSRIFDPFFTTRQVGQGMGLA